MLTRIDVECENAFFIPIIGVTTKDTLLIRKVTGLNPPDPDLFVGSYSRDGGIYQGRRVGNRNIVLTVDLNPNPALGETVSGLRNMLYAAFMDPQANADHVKLTFHDSEGVVCYAVGYAEKFEAEPFDMDKVVQVSLICPDPYLRDNVEVVLSQDPGWTETSFEYSGNARAGFDAKIRIDAPTNVLTLENNGRKMVMSRQFAEGDLVRVQTHPGERNLTVTPSGGTEKSILGSLSPLSPWLEFKARSNQISVYGSDPLQQVGSIYEIRYTPAYWGI